MSRMRRVADALILVLFVSACSWLLYPYKKPVPQPREAEARQIVLDVFRLGLGPTVDHATVRLYWHKTICPYAAADGTKKTAVIHNGKCFNGLTFFGGVCRVAWRGSFSSSAYAHELLHAYLNATGHGGEQIDLADDDPKLCVWCRELEREANRRLTAAGL